MGNFESLSKAPAASPLRGGRVQQWGRKGRKEVGAFGAEGFPFLLELGMLGIEF